jgi:hypothetical protein
MKRLLALAIAPLVRRDYRLREQGKRPDRRYWADVLLLRLGYVVDYTGEMKQTFLRSGCWRIGWVSEPWFWYQGRLWSVGPDGNWRKHKL